MENFDTRYPQTIIALRGSHFIHLEKNEKSLTLVNPHLKSLYISDRANPGVIAKPGKLLKVIRSWSTIAHNKSDKFVIKTKGDSPFISETNPLIVIKFVLLYTSKSTLFSHSIAVTMPAPRRHYLGESRKIAVLHPKIELISES